MTAHARRNLWTGILACGNDYKYSDTDSIKITNYEKHMDYIEKYNARCIDLIKKYVNGINLILKILNPLT